MDNDTKLMDKNVNDLTVGDAVKINLVAVGICAAVPVVIIAADAAKDKVQTFLRQRKIKKITENTEK